MGQFKYILPIQGLELLVISTIWHENFWRWLTIMLSPCRRSHMPSARFPNKFNWSKVFFKGLKNGIFMYIKSCNCYDLDIPWIICAHLFPCNSSSPMFQDPLGKLRFDLKTCAWKLHNQHLVKCTQNNPFMGFEC